MRLNPHLYFDGQCEAAFKLYAECLGGEITMRLTWGESPLASTLLGFDDKVLHATLKVGDGVLTGADVPRCAVGRGRERSRWNCRETRRVPAPRTTRPSRRAACVSGSDSRGGA